MALGFLLLVGSVCAALFLFDSGAGLQRRADVAKPHGHGQGPVVADGVSRAGEEASSAVLQRSEAVVGERETLSDGAGAPLAIAVTADAEPASGAIVRYLWLAGERADEDAALSRAVMRGLDDLEGFLEELGSLIPADQEGIARIARPRAGGRLLVHARYGMQSGEGAFPVGPAEERIGIAVRLDRRIPVLVLDEWGGPVTGVSIGLESRDPDGCRWNSLATATHADGVARLRPSNAMLRSHLAEFGPQYLRLCVWAPGAMDCGVAWSDASAAGGGSVISTRGLGQLRVVLSNLPAGALNSLRATLEQASPSIGDPGDERPAFEGVPGGAGFAWDQVGVGSQLVLRVEMNGQQLVRRLVFGPRAPGTEVSVDVDLGLGAGRQVSLLVMRDGTAYSRGLAQVRIGSDDEVRDLLVRTDKAGRLFVPVSTEEAVSVSIQSIGADEEPDGYVGTTSLAGGVGQGDGGVVDLRAAPVLGTVLVEDDLGQGVEAELQATWVGDRGGRRVGVIRRARGAFDLFGDVEGREVAVVASLSGDGESRAIRVPLGESVRLVVARRTRLRCVVSLAEGVPATQLEAMLTDSEGRVGIRQLGLVSQVGDRQRPRIVEAVWGNIAVGDYTMSIRFRGGGCEVVRQQVHVGEGESLLELDLRDDVTAVTVSTVDVQGAPVATRGEILIHEGAGRRRIACGAGRGETLVALGPGPVSMDVSREGYAVRAVVLSQRQDVRVTLQAARPGDVSAPRAR